MTSQVNDNNFTDKNENSFIDELMHFFKTIGQLTIHTINFFKVCGERFYHRFIKKHIVKMQERGKKILVFSKTKRESASAKSKHTKAFFKNAVSVLKNAYNKEPDAAFFKKFKNMMSALAVGSKKNKRVFAIALNYAAPLVAFVVLINVVSYVSSLNFAVAVEYNGDQIGYITDETVYNQAEAKLQERMIYTDDDTTYKVTPKFTIAVADDSALKSQTELTNTIVKSSSGDIVKATGLTVDGVFYGAVKDATTLQNTLDDILEKYSTSNSSEQVSFAKDVQLDTGLYLATNIVDEDELVNLVTGKEKKDVYYTVVKGDSPITIASKNDISLSELVKLNPGITENCPIGKQVVINKSQSFLPVKVTRRETYTQTIKYDTTYVQSNKLYVGTSMTTKNGVNGSKKVTADVEYVDGVEVGRTVITSEVTKQPVTRIVAKGTKAMPVVSSSYNGKVSNSGFIWPVSGGYISQYYKGTLHNGIDYAFRGNGYGVPIRASLAGTVVRAGWAGSYGNLVVIQTPGGIQTWYAHCSKIVVSVGQTVAQGQQIANVGSTGNSSGNHLHFRVLINGVEKNPLNYLP